MISRQHEPQCLKRPLTHIESSSSAHAVHSNAYSDWESDPDRSFATMSMLSSLPCRQRGGDTDSHRSSDFVNIIWLAYLQPPGVTTTSQSSVDRETSMFMWLQIQSRGLAAMQRSRSSKGSCRRLPSVSEMQTAPQVRHQANASRGALLCTPAGHLCISPLPCLSNFALICLRGRCFCRKCDLHDSEWLAV